jgi:hypothetical protein
MNNEEHDEPQVKSEEEEVSQSTSQELQNDVNVEEQFEDDNQDEENQDEENDDDDDNEEEDDDSQSAGSSVNEMHNIDLSDNEFYKGLCTLLEDEQGNNILEYISLLHTELIGLNKNMRLVRKDIGRIATCAEILVKSKM